MGGAPTIVWLRSGVGYEPGAAASMRRLEAALGRAHDCNSSYRDWAAQQRMYLAWEAWVAGRGPKPPHSRAISPDASAHCKGLGDDSDDWMTPGYIALAADHGWIRTAATDPTERHHFEYQWWNDRYRNQPAPAATPTTQPTPEPTRRKLTMNEALIVHQPSGNLIIVNVRDRTLINLGPDKHSQLRAWFAENHPYKFMGGDEWDRNFGTGTGYNYVGHTPA